MRGIIGPAHHRWKVRQRIRPVSGWEAISGLKGRLALAQIGPALIGMVGRDRGTEDLPEVIDRELQVTLGDGHMRMPERLLHIVNIGGREIVQRSDGVAQGLCSDLPFCSSPASRMALVKNLGRVSSTLASVSFPGSRSIFAVDISHFRIARIERSQQSGGFS